MSDFQQTHIYAPASLSDLIHLYKAQSGADLFSGGTYFYEQSKQLYPLLPKSVIYLGQVKELQKIRKTDRFFEFGSGICLNHILDIGAHLIPGIFLDALKSIGNYPVRNLATLGGTLSLPNRRADIFPALSLIDTKIELRSSKGSRWIPLARFISSENTLNFKDAELLTKVKVPVRNWKHFDFYKDNKAQISTGFVANNEENVLSDIRFYFMLNNLDIYRSREIEAELAGKKIPLTIRDKDAILTALGSFIEKHNLASFFVHLLYNRLTALLSAIMDKEKSKYAN